MGLPMARNAARAGLEVSAWNRTREKAEPLAEDGVEIASTPAEAAEGAELIVTMLRDAEAVLDSVEGDDGALAAAEKDAIWVQMSTIGIDATERCAALAAERGVEFVDAPVTGTKGPAEEGELTVFASGPESARELCAPLFDAVGKKILWVGEAGAGTRLKLVVNSWLLSVVEGVAETLALAEGIGVDPAQFLEAISGSPIDTGYAQLKGKAMIERDFGPSFKLELAAKDAGLVAEAIERHGLELPLLETIRERLAEAAREHGDEDVAATFLASTAPTGSR
jgi:3-hydroxyisobutyrate dehydrogenase